MWGVMFLVVPPKERFAQMPMYIEFVKKTTKNEVCVSNAMPFFCGAMGLFH
jgi:hypothetical protein